MYTEKSNTLTVMFKGIFIADLHCSKQREKDCLFVLDCIYQKLLESSTKHYVFIAGDFWDSPITNNESFANIISKVKDIASITKVFMIYGTPTHENAGSLEVFKLLGCTVFDRNTYVKYDDFELIALPEPRKVNFAHKVKNGISAADLIVEDMKQFFKTIPERCELPRICIFHNEVIGDSMVNGADCKSQTGLRPHWLVDLDCDFIAGGHIHKADKVKGVPNCYYLGSSPAKNWDENHVPAYTICEIGD